MAFDWDTPLTLGEAYDTSAQVGADSSYLTPRTPDTQTTNALQTMTPTQSPGLNDSWGSWFRTVGSGIVGYAIQKDAVQNNVTRPSQTAPYQANGTATQKPLTANGLVVLAIVGGLIFFAVKKAG